MELLKYTYKYIQVSYIDKVMGESKEGYYPTLPCRFRSAKKESGILNGLLDSGADGITIPKILTKRLGLELEEADSIGVIGGMARRGVAEVDLIIGSHGRYTELKDVEVSVPLDEEMGPVVLGRNPIFKHYDITFSDADLKVTLTPHKHKSKEGKERISKRI